MAESTPNPNDERWERLDEIFECAAELPATAVGPFLDEACGEDADLRAEIESLLSHRSGAPTRFLRPPRDDPERSGPARDVTDPLINKRLGPYLVRNLIGSGGMGRVYRAIQEKPRQTVALKVLKPGIASRAALRRFESEAQILARMHHPNVAQVFTADVHAGPEGDVPYFALEYIPNARTITEYAEAEDLDLRRRLELFIQVCEAIHHGHQRGIIHRDLKPGNILVDSTGMPKVIDFGVARATDSDLAAISLQTDIGQLIGTLPYMSPEQCAADPDDLDIRSDVYALGVILFELLSGKLPHELAKKALAEAVRIIQHDPPARPSSFNTKLRGDVETIVLKALEKSRPRRYDSAASFARDIHRFLHNEPIDARPPSFAYQARMFARRHRVAFGAAVTVIAVLVVAVAGLTIAFGRAKHFQNETFKALGAKEVALAETVAANAELGRERDRVRQQYELMRGLADDLLNDHYDAVKTLPAALDALEALSETALRFIEALEREARDDVELQLDLARAHRKRGLTLWTRRGPNLGQRDQALVHYSSALRIHEELRDRDPGHLENRMGLLSSHVLLGDFFLESQSNLEADRARALEHYDQATTICRSLRDDARGDDRVLRLMAVTLQSTAQVLWEAEEHERATVMFRDSLELRQRRVASRPDDPEALRDLSVGLIRNGYILSERGKLAEALQYYERSLEIRRDLAVVEPLSTRTQRDVAVGLKLLADGEAALGIDSELAHRQEAVAILEMLVEKNPRDRRVRRNLPQFRIGLADALQRAGKHEEAVRELEKAGKAFATLVQEEPEDEWAGKRLQEVEARLAAPIEPP